MPPFAWQVVDGCTCATHGSECIVNKQVPREDHQTAVQSGESGEMQPKTVIVIVGAIICFLLLLLGFWWVAQKPRTLAKPGGDRVGGRPQVHWGFCGFSRWFCLRSARRPANPRHAATQDPVAVHQPAQPPPKSLHACPSLTHTHVTEETLTNFHNGAFELDDEIGDFMIQHAGRTGLMDEDGAMTDVESSVPAEARKLEDVVVTATFRAGHDGCAQGGFARSLDVAESGGVDVASYDNAATVRSEAAQ